MAWPKLKSHKSPGQRVTRSSHSGVAPDGARSHDSAPPKAAGEPAGLGVSEPDVPGVADVPGVPDGPAVWPEGDVAAEDSAPDAAEDPGDVPFWDWAPPEEAAEPDDGVDERFSVDDAGGSPPRAMAPAEPARPSWRPV